MNIRGNLIVIRGITKWMLETDDKSHHSMNDVGKTY